METESHVGSHSEVADQSKNCSTKKYPELTVPIKRHSTIRTQKNHKRSLLSLLMFTFSAKMDPQDSESPEKLVLASDFKLIE